MASRCSLDTFNYIPVTNPFWIDLQTRLAECRMSNLPTDSEDLKEYICPFVVESIEEIKERFQQFLEKFTASQFGHSREFECYVPFNPLHSIKIITCFRGKEQPLMDRTRCVFMKAVLKIPLHTGSDAIKQEIMGNTHIQIERDSDEEWSQLLRQMREMLSAKQKEVAKKSPIFS